MPAATERPAGPEHDRRGEGELIQFDNVGRPSRDRRRDGRPFRARLRGAQDEADPEPSRHVGEFRIGRASRLATWAPAPCRRSGSSGTDLADLRMHRAGVVVPSGTAAFGSCPSKIGEGIGGEFGAAAGRAEMVGLAAVIEAVLAACGFTVMPQTGSRKVARRPRIRDSSWSWPIWYGRRSRRSWPVRPFRRCC